MGEIIKLSQRLEMLGSLVPRGQAVADIGTDHGYLPIYLIQKGISPRVIASDVNQGPLKITRENLRRYLGDDWKEKGVFLRQADGLAAFSPGEVSCAVLAGMGGLLMIRILESSPLQTRSLCRLILQPRNAPDKLRRWLLEKGFFICREALVREGKFIWEIMAAEPPERGRKKSRGENPAEGDREDPVERAFSGQYLVGLDLIRRKDPLLCEYLRRHMAVEENIYLASAASDQVKARKQREQAMKKMQLYRRILEYVHT